MDVKERCQGCLVGGAAGDALGYEVEFDGLKQIKAHFGKNGITEYVLHNGNALISDDTQMTLFTAEGVLRAENNTVESCRDAIAQAYKEWDLTQYNRYPLPEQKTADSRLLHVPELFCPRAPGNTCLSAIKAGCHGSVASPINNSKGCGGVMRVAPIGLYLPAAKMSPDDCDRLGAEAAALTHGHDLGWLPAAMLVHMVRRLTHEEVNMHTAAASGISAMMRLFPEAAHLRDFIKLMDYAVRLADSSADKEDAIFQIGEGWVGDEALAVALFCAIRFENDFAGGIIAAVNHNGDSDSTGAIAGNLLGARLGLSGIPEQFRTNLELYDLMLEMGAELSLESGA